MTKGTRKTKAGKSKTGLIARPETEERTHAPVAYAKTGLELLEAQPDDIVLDIGCKGGWLEYQLHQKVKKMVGVDMDAPFIAENNKINKYHNISYEVADVSHQLPFADNTFTKVALFEVLEHIPPKTEPRALAEIYRVLKPGGTLVLTTPHANWLSTILDPAWWFLGHRHYRADSLAKMLHQVGYQPIQIFIKGRMWHALSVFFYYPMRLVRIEKLTAGFMPRLVQREFNRGAGFVHLIVTATKPR
ncbi:MAG: methyltransferase domain-containing protein [bacterium]|nr:methyltransferase domain-containing protein [bacterium]